MDIQVNQNTELITPLFEINQDDLNTFQFEESLYGSQSIYDKFKLENPIPIQSHYDYDEITSSISKIGTISPSGHYLDTPENIKLQLKPHQTRTLYEMFIRENYKYRLVKDNLLLLCDNVGSGKSLCVLALIAKSPLVQKVPENIYFLPNVSNYSKINYSIHGTTISPNIYEIKSNLIVVPHGIYNQWKNYIIDYTNLSYLAIGSKKEIKELGSSKEDILNKLDSHNIVLVKSTKFIEFYRYLKDFDIKQTTNNIVSNTNSALFDIEKVLSKLRGIYDELYNECMYDGAYESLDTYTQKIEGFLKTVNINNAKNSKNMSACDDVDVISGYIFQRVIFDEADSVKIPSCPRLYGKFTWLVTSSINNLLYPKGKRVYENYKYKELSQGIGGSGFIKDLMRNCVEEKYNKTRIFHTIVRSNYDFIQDSIKIPDPLVDYIKCYTPPELLAISSAINPDVLKALNAGDTQTAIKMMGCESGTEEDLVKIVNKTLYKKEEELKLLIAEKIEKQNENIQLQSALKEVIDNMAKTHPDYENMKTDMKTLKSTAQSIKSSIENFTEQLKSTQAKIAGIEERIKGTKDKVCPVCSGSVNNPCLTNCCRNVFCFECLSMAITYSPKKECPLCRTTVDMNKIHLIVDINNKKKEENKEDDADELLKKMATLLKFIKNNPNKKLLVFSEYEDTFNLIQHEFISNGVRFSKISGSAARINNIITKYKSGEYQVLLLNASNFGAGLNLQITDDIIIYHRMSKDLERQVIGRAQRLGRMEPLNIRYLCHENEYPTGTL
jgi:hypothetical protein